MDDSVTPLDVVHSSAQNVSPKATLVFNVGGVTFETYMSTLLRLPNSRLNNTDFLHEHFRPERSDYFFDRDADAFKVLFEYLRTGQLYIPTYIDRPSLRSDLLYWGLTFPEIQQVGAGVPLQYQQKDGNLYQMETRHTITNTRDTNTQVTTRTKIWNVLTRPSTSLIAKLYAALTYFLIAVSVFIIVFETTSLFRVDVADEMRQTVDIVSDVSYIHPSIYVIF